MEIPRIIIEMQKFYGFGMPETFLSLLNLKGDENAKNENPQICCKALQSNSNRQDYEKTSWYRPLAPTQIII